RAPSSSRPSPPRRASSRSTWPSLGPQPALVQPGGGLAGHHAALAGQLVDYGVPPGDPPGGVDDDRDGGHVPAQLQQPVAGRDMVAVKAPDAAPRGGAAEPGRTQPTDDRAVHRLALVPRRLRGVDHELLPLRRPVLAGSGEALAVPLADADALQGKQRAA